MSVEERLDAIDRKLAVAVEVARRVESRVIETNGRLREVERNEIRRDGALDALRWMVGVAIGIMGVGATIAGVVLGFVVNA